MKNNTIAALAFGALLVIVALLSTPFVSDRINGMFGKDEAPAEQVAEEPSAGASTVEDAPAETGTPDGQSVTETADRPGAAEPAEAATAAGEGAGDDEDADTSMASLPQQDEVAGTDVVVPTFGLLRVEPDGSTVIAGQAGPGARIEVLTGDRMLAGTMAESNGDFVAILEEPLEPGDYEIVLRSTEPDGDVAMSTETAIISVPDKGREGELLALVEQPGEPSRLINTPKPVAPQAETEPGQAAVDAPEAAPDTAAPQDAGSEPDTEMAAAEPQGNGGAATAAPGDIRIDAVEIDGDTVFVAGSARPGAQVRVYANDILLGDTTAGPNGRFLVEVKVDLPVGDYIIRADVINSVTADVVARAAVPFTREAGERVAAVATTPETSPEGGTVEVPLPSAALPDGPPPVPEGVTVTGQLKRTNSSVIIRRGDTLWHISRRIYGEGIRYTTIYLANEQQIKDPDMIWPGQIFTLPDNPDG
ncbi:LysM peptidoglycan-binding domain-containing protein [Oricola thermophila]|uniref:LysM peptidoglycan-binding domain-containing protein n=1 Tax=Oricola thermophila TaxID=2742145 RepID=A0A6N1VC67_9HYPH|nr:LysM peptidoglycan-binding domain-containing protein [Oricola thermophila]QKV18444.1 LysM peptidoglycan-binding domain-containing protein [Oricola thermophila]